MRKLILALLVVTLLASGSAFAQTATNTATATATSTPTSTSTRTATRTLTPPRADSDGSTDFKAFKYGSFKVDADTSLTGYTRQIPGIKPGDLIVLYPQTGGCIATVDRITNNFIVFTMACGADPAEQDVEYLMFSRTQNNCQGAPNCQRAPTVTATP